MNELYIKYFTDVCPGCGSMAQRDGGACNNVTCPHCRTTFKCMTATENTNALNLSPRYVSPRARAASPRSSSPRSPRYSPAPRSKKSTAYDSPMDITQSTVAPMSPYPSSHSIRDDYSPVMGKTDSSEMKYFRQRSALRMCLDIMLQQLDLDQLLEKEKEMLWQNGVNVEAAFGFLDRYGKGYVADTDVWQLMHSESSYTNVSFAGVCTLFRDVKAKGAPKPGALNLAELTKFLFPRQSEEWLYVEDFMNDSETKNVLYVTRATIACPGCKTRTQRTLEGCPQVDCPVCGTTFRCNLIGTDKDQEFRLSNLQKARIRDLVKTGVEVASEHERLRTILAKTAGHSESLSSVLLDAFMVMSEDKGYLTFSDMKRHLMMHKALRLSDVEMLWYRFARNKPEIGFVEFAGELRPFGSEM